MTDADDLEPADRITGGPLLDLHDQLVAAAERRDLRPAPSRLNHRRLLLLVAASVVVLAGVAGVLIVDDDGPASADVHVELVGGRVRVSIEHEVSATQIHDALARADVAVAVVGQTTGPSLRYRFLGISGSHDALLEGGDGHSAVTASFSAGDKVQLVVGVAAEPDQAYDVPTDPSAPGEPLAGLVVVGTTYAKLRAALEARAPSVTIQFRGATGQPVAEPGQDAVIADAKALSDRLVVLYLR